MDTSYPSNPGGHPGGGYPPASTYSQEQSISFWNILAGVWSRKFLILCVFATVMAGVVFGLSIAKPRYTPELRILIEGRDNPFTQPQSNTNQRATVDSNEVASQVQVLLSSDLGQKVAKDLNLAQYSEFNSAAKEDSALTKLFKMLGIYMPPADQSVQQKVLEKYFKNLNVYPVQDSRVIVVEFTSKDPEIAAKVANAIGRTYVLATREVKYDAAKTAMKWLSGEIGRLRQTVATSEAAVEEFRARKGLFKSENTTLDAQELAGINSQIILASAARSEAQARARAIREMLKSRGGVDASSAVLNSTVIQRLREQQVTLQRTVADLEATFLPTHPRMVRLAAEIKKLSTQIRAEALKIVESLESDARVQGAREAELRANLAQLKTKASTTSQDEITLRALEREAEANRSLLQTFLQRFTEASARQDIAVLPAGARIISRAQVLGKPTFPKTKPLFLMGLVGAAVTALLVAFVAQVMSSTPMAPVPSVAPTRREPEFVEPPATPEPQMMQPEPQPTAVAPLAPVPEPVSPPETAPQSEPDLQSESVPQAEATAAPQASEMPVATPISPAVPEPVAVQAPEKLVTELGPVVEELTPLINGKADIVEASALCVTDPLGEFSMAIRRIYQRMFEAGHKVGTKRYMWTCGEDHEDKVPVLVNLARTFAQNGNKTIIVDADFSSDELTQAFGMISGAGLSDLLAGGAAFTDAIVRDNATGVHVLRQGMVMDQAANLLGGKRMDYILNALDQAYEVVLVNVGPMADGSAQQVAQKMAYAVIFAEATKSGKRAGATAMQIVRSLGVANTEAVTVQNTNAFGRFLSKYRKAA